MEQNRYLCFNVGKDEFAVPLSLIKEVIMVPRITPVPKSEKYFLGFINLRGKVISIIDLRLKLGFSGEIKKDTPALVIEVNHNLYAVVCDTVNQVCSPSSEEITDKPEAGSHNAHSEYITKVFRKKDSLTLIVDLQKALDISDAAPEVAGAA